MLRRGSTAIQPARVSELLASCRLGTGSQDIYPLDEFAIDIFVDGYASSLRPPELATRSQKAFMRLAKGNIYTLVTMQGSNNRYISPQVLLLCRNCQLAIMWLGVPWSLTSMTHKASVASRTMSPTIPTPRTHQNCQDIYHRGQTRWTIAWKKPYWLMIHGH